MTRINVTAKYPAFVELSRRTTKNAMRIDVRDGKYKIGTLYIAQGSVEWWPRDKKVNARRGHWKQLADILEEHLPKRRSSRS